MYRVTRVSIIGGKVSPYIWSWNFKFNHSYALSMERTMRIRCLYVFHFCTAKHVTRMSQTPNRLKRSKCEIALCHTAFRISHGCVHCDRDVRLIWAQLCFTLKCIQAARAQVISVAVRLNGKHLKFLIQILKKSLKTWSNILPLE